MDTTNGTYRTKWIQVPPRLSVKHFEDLRAADPFTQSDDSATLGSGIETLRVPESSYCKNNESNCHTTRAIETDGCAAAHRHNVLRSMRRSLLVTR